MDPRRVGPYDLRAPIGGRIGDTYDAISRESRARVVFREFPGLLESRRLPPDDPSATDVFQTLLDRLQGVEHPNVITAYDAGDRGGTPYLVRDFLRATPLDRVSLGGLSAWQILEIALSVSEALAALHRGRVVHGNLQPTNVLVGNMGEVVVTDAGLTDLVSAVEAESGLRFENIHLPAVNRYRAPELAQTTLPDERSDAFALGKIINWLDQGHSRRSPQPISGLDAIVRHLTTADPDRRPNAGDAVEMLRELQDHLPLAGGMGEWPEPSHEPEPQPASIAQAAPRFVNTWFASDDDVPPLRVDRWYDFTLNIGARREESGGQSHAFGEPDFGGQSSIRLLASLASDDFEFASYRLALDLPRVGDSEPVATRLRPLHDGACRLQVILSLARELEILQILELHVDVIPEPALVTMGGA